VGKTVYHEFTRRHWGRASQEGSKSSFERARLPTGPEKPRFWVAQRFQRCDKGHGFDSGPAGNQPPHRASSGPSSELGKRFLINSGNLKEGNDPLTLVLDWPAALKK
jgi:hypothetical protein